MQKPETMDKHRHQNVSGSSLSIFQPSVKLL